nr:GGDEF domain-containing protein [Treponema sp.]
MTRNIPIAGRLGGDEFIILLRMESPEQTENKMRELMDRLSEVKFDGLDGIRTSVGVTEITGDDRDLDAAYKRADDALYESKRAGKNQITIG